MTKIKVLSSLGVASRVAHNIRRVRRVILIPIKHLCYLGAYIYVIWPYRIEVSFWSQKRSLQNAPRAFVIQIYT